MDSCCFKKKGGGRGARGGRGGKQGKGGKGGEGGGKGESMQVQEHHSATDSHSPA